MANKILNLLHLRLSKIISRILPYKCFLYLHYIIFLKTETQIFYRSKLIHFSQKRIYRQSPHICGIDTKPNGYRPMWLFRQSLVHAMVCFAPLPPTHNATWHYLWYVLFALGTEECVLLMNIFTSWIHSKQRDAFSFHTFPPEWARAC